MKFANSFKKMFYFLVILFTLANFATCWPDFELYTQKNKDQFVQIDVNNCKKYEIRKTNFS